jgi:hypothetical protein
MLNQGTSNIDSNQSEIVSDSVPHVEVEKKVIYLQILNK